MNMDNRYEEIVYSRYKVRVNDMAILEVDEGFEKILGFTAADVRERNLSVQDIILEEDWEDYYRIVYSKMGSSGEAYLGHRLRKKKRRSYICILLWMGFAYRCQWRYLWRCVNYRHHKDEEYAGTAEKSGRN